MPKIGGLVILAVLAAGAAAAQEIAMEPQLLFNQHLYYGTFSRPRGIAFDRAHNEVWVADTGNGLIGIFRPDGAELFSFASKEFLRDPVRVAIAPDGGVVVIEGDRTKIRKFDYRGTYKGDVPLPGVGEKPIFGALAYDGGGNLYVADNRSSQVFVYSPEGKLKRQFGSRGTDEGQFQAVCGIAVDGDGTIYITDQQAIAVQVFDNQGNFVRGWGKHEMGADNVSLPSGIALDNKGHVFVTDELRHQVKVFTTGGKLLNQFGGLGDGLGQLSFPTDVAADGNGRIYVTERSTSRVQVFQFSSTEK